MLFSFKQKRDTKVGHFLIAIIRSMWSHYASVQFVIGAEYIRCENVFIKFPSFSCNGWVPVSIFVSLFKFYHLGITY